MKLDKSRYGRMKRLHSAGVFFFTFIALICADPFCGNGKMLSILAECSIANALTTGDQTASAAAFIKASQVLLHPRCVNCHPAGDRPLISDQSVPHPMNIMRGPDGLGKNGLLCGACHQEMNLPGVHMPPGGPDWRLTSADMPMVFEKRTPRQLCEQLKDPAQNGRRSLAEVLKHVREAPLVLWGWNPGAGRTPVPITHEAFVKYMAEWIDKGAACPE